MARKPRELWSASYLFSYLMKCIYSAAEDAKAEIISPAKPTEEKCEVGIYPDRIFIKGEFKAKEVITNATQSFYHNLYGKGENPNLDYFNIMTATCEAEKESKAIAELNQKLDVMELCNFASADTDAAQTVYKVISKEKDNPLFKLATDKDNFYIKEIEKIASVQKDKNKDAKEFSHHRYFCVVQADGDNVGKTVSHKDLKDGEVFEISKALVAFGLKASEIIKKFGGEPIYAGGDDLLFIAPVIGIDGTNIFSLIEKIENDAFKDVHDKVSKFGLKDKDGNIIEASLSFGISISYHKHPLYEALATARKQLFGIAKNIEGKKAAAWTLRKHSGGTFSASFSRKNKELQEQFKQLIQATADEATVSAVAHKIRQFDDLVNIVLASEDYDRLNALFEKVLECTKEKESYFKAVKALMPTLYKVIGEKEYAPALYCLLRTAKFIKGEDLRDE